MKRRASGVLCHVTSLPSPFGIGDLGPGAYRFAEFLHEAKQGYWQVLPLNPTNERYLNSPFISVSSCAGNTALVSPQLLVADGLLTQAEVEDHPPFDALRVDYNAVSRFKDHLFLRAHHRFKEEQAADREYAAFCRDNGEWLEDHALHNAMTAHLNGLPLAQWPEALRRRTGDEVRQMSTELSDAVEREKFLQYLFNRQWHALKQHCNEKGISIIGDFPMFMSYDAADIWVHPEFFKVDENKQPLFQAGSPPDSFSAKGQLFDCAAYDWSALRESGFSWWVTRFRHLFRRFDLVRIDHFRGLISYWEVPAGAKDALQGNWQPAPCDEFLDTMVRYFPSFPVIAEDLGVITAEVREKMAQLGIPGMKVLVVAFQDDAGIYLPHRHPENSIAYTGTHDTNTARGWFEGAAPDAKRRLSDYIGRDPGDEAAWELIRLAQMSPARTAMMQLQDLVGGGAGTRMNTPGSAEGNWQWRLAPSADLTGVAQRLAEMTLRYDRAR